MKKNEAPTPPKKQNDFGADKKRIQKIDIAIKNDNPREARKLVDGNDIEILNYI